MNEETKGACLALAVVYKKDNSVNNKMSFNETLLFPGDSVSGFRVSLGP